MAFPDIVIGSKFDGKGFKQAETALNKLGKSAKGVGELLGVSLGAAAVVAFGKVTVKAFMDDQKAAAQLSNTVKNLGLAFADADVQGFVTQLSLATGVTKDQLYPAMQKLLQTTGSVVDSQKLLTTAIDISKGSGVDLATVATDLSAAYVGNNKGLKKYALGLSQAELKTASFDKVLGAFNKNFAGASQANLGTVAGQFGLITNAAHEAEVSIGSGLVDAFKTLTSGADFSNLAEKISNLGTGVADFFRGLAQGFKDLANMPIIKQLLQIIGFFVGGTLKNIYKAVIQPFVQAGAASTAKGYGDYAGSTDAITRAKNAAAAAKAEADAKKRAKELLAAQTKNTAELKKQAALKKDGTVFDMQQIELIAALKGKLSDDDRARAELQLALLNGNADAADKLTKQILMTQDATGNLYKYFQQIGDTTVKNPFAYLDTWIADFQKKLNDLQFPVPATTGTYTPAGLAPELAAIGVVAGYGAGTPMTVANQASTTLGNGLYGMQTVSEVGGNGSSSAPVIYNYFGGSVVTDQALLDQVMNGTQLASLSGSPSQIGRIAGMFG